jgi:DNA-binding SARP family transcriptional activator
VNVWIEALGPLSVWHSDQYIPVSAPKQRVVLALLLIKANQVVSAEELTDRLWDGSPPPACRVTLQGYIRRLRQLLGPVAGARLVTRGAGYLVQFHHEELDLLRFADRYQEGAKAHAAGQWAQASAALGSALSLWKGAPLSDAPCEYLQRDEAPRLQEMRWQAAEWRAEAELFLGRYDRLVPELRSLVAEQPLRERFHAQLMIALNRAGRRAEALAVYRGIRDNLRDDLGIDPGPELRQLHEGILRGESLGPSA